ncbi:hypothetical protein PACTADRAFT_51972 [Pachysolen tannophilus NRRL Y-2460]|uniref:phosphoinositide 5-phosphatase n=1 Tax=Pachysolen tannophilus NRRL Y-2460 TaxID=669874 RepID=A0A1E4TNP4_PACTA|nr:hypothetical protein PACTADRAFT_51972 [Pachysolen tannophilus NRRL Y-2460]
MKVYLNKNPRSIALISNGFALIFRDISSSANVDQTLTNGNNAPSNHQLSDKDFNPRCIVEFVAESSINLDSYSRLLASNDNCEFLGLICLKTNIYLGIISQKVEVGSIRPNEKVNKITNVDFLCLNNDEFDELFENQMIVSDLKDKLEAHPCHSLKKLLSGGSFFYSRDFDIASTCQERGTKKGFTVIEKNYDFKFMWNSFMNDELIEFRNRLSKLERKSFDESEFLTTIIRGFVKTVNTTLGIECEALLTIISKQSCRRKGSLYGPWGLDDDGNVANFMETECVLYFEKFCFAYTQVRGNIPVFWELENQLLSTKVKFSRSVDSTQHAFNRHFETLIQQHGEIHILNALNKKSNQHELSNRYTEVLGKSSSIRDQVDYSHIEFSTDSLKNNYSTRSKLLYLLESSILRFGAYCYDVSKHIYIGKQSGVFLVNTFDSLEKANTIQKIINKEAFGLSFKDMGIVPSDDFFDKLRLLWDENGIWLSKITLSTMSTKTNQINKSGGLVGVVAGVSKKYIANTVAYDPTKVKQNAIDKLLGRMNDQNLVKLHDPIHDFIADELKKKSDLFSSSKEISLFCSTFNINGVQYDEDISTWIFPDDKTIDTNPDIVAIGFEEIVELTPGQMLDTDNSTRYFWEKKLKKCLNERDKYVLLWGGQLGGIVLLLFVKEAEAEEINNVEGSIRKTGLGGMASNKGAIALSFTFSTTKFCFIVSHLAAGLNNVEERHQDYKTIAKNIRFSRNRSIKDHDAVIWMGDFNFRIDLTNEEVRNLIEKQDFQTLFDNDQLNNQMAKGESFPYFDEMEIRFPPTYKFDNGTKTYDTSEKQRIPAWTDRILSLSRNKILKQLSYDCCQDILFSDHRPVYAFFKAKVIIVNEKIKQKVAHELYKQRKAEIGDANELITSNYINEITLTHGFPPPSSDKTKWWIDGGQPVKVTFPDLAPGMIVNPNLPINPFVETDEPDFIMAK